ncbi:MAG: DEAD/DEAH box helicase, partial [Candidatus Cloacimonetes bacterium]|nr:DEAD/DEAH box helicase [Candidatus Cloacimonadota bacterium]
VKIFVLDEADRMVEMGFIDDVEKIIKACPTNRQTLLFSATIYGPTKEIAKKYMKDPAIVHVTKMVDPTKLKQTYYDVPSNLKKELLIHLLQKETSNLVMVFCNTRRAVDIVVKFLQVKDIKAALIHGGLTQEKRLRTIDLFHKGKFQVLGCTDVAARGLHIEGVTHIYNFDMPKTPGDYIHRIGRTARVGKNGLVINIISRGDYNNFSVLQNTYREFDIQKKERPYLKIDITNKSEMKPSRKSSDFRNRKSYQGKNTDRYRKSSSKKSGPQRNFKRKSN